MMVQNARNAERVLKIFNKQNPNIQFDIEKPENLSDGSKRLSLLDFTITVKDGSTKFTFYKKEARKNMFIHKKSALSETSKKAIIKNEINRINECCAHEQIEVDRAINSFGTTLKLYGYSSHYIYNIVNLRSNNSTTYNSSDNANNDNNNNHSTNNDNTNHGINNNHNINNDNNNKEDENIYLKFPYISEKMNRKFKKLFKNEGFHNIRLAQRSNRNIRNELKNNCLKQRWECKRRNCAMKYTSRCYCKNLIYKSTCKHCHEFYVGSSIRDTHDRYREHKYKSSSIHQHIQEEHEEYSTNILENYNAEIITRGKDTIDTRITEAYYIKKLKPKINKREELNDYGVFLFNIE